MFWTLHSLQLNSALWVKTPPRYYRAVFCVVDDMPQQKPKAVVTGGAGFIGSHLADALVREGYGVTVIDNLSTGKEVQVNKKAKFVQADIRDLASIKPHFENAKYVFHLAARARIQPSIADPEPTFHDNIIGTLNVLLASRDAKVRRVVYSASSSSYGDQEALPLHEGMQSRFKSPYSLSKYVGEETCRLFSSLYGLETVSLRYFNVYGPRQLTTGAYATVVGIFLDQLEKGRPITIVEPGLIRRDFTHISDVVRANMLAANSNKVGAGDTINIGTGKNYSINEVAAMILQHNEATKQNAYEVRLASAPLVGDPKIVLASAVKIGKVEYVPKRPGESLVTLADNTKAKKLLGWEPKVSLSDGIAGLMMP